MKQPNIDGLGVRDLALLTWRQIWDLDLPDKARKVGNASMAAAVPLLFMAAMIAAHLLPDLSGHGQPGVGNLTADQLQTVLKEFFPDIIYNVVATVLINMQSLPPAMFISLTAVTALWTSSGAFTAIFEALNLIYGVKETRSWWKVYLLALFMCLIQSLLLCVCLAVLLAFPHVLALLHLSTEHTILLTCCQWLVLYVMLIISYALTFRVGPDAPQRYTWVTPGAVVGAFLFLVASWVFRFYVQQFASYTVLYGPLGGIVALMLWFYIISWVLLAAAQINRLVAESKVGKPKPPEDKSGGPKP